MQLKSILNSVEKQKGFVYEKAEWSHAGNAIFVTLRPHYHTSGMGHVYQQRDKSFPIQDDEHLFVVCRYVERNALRAGLVDQAEQWR